MAQDAPKEAVASSQELAKKISNPVADIITMPIEFNFDQHLGALNGDRYYANLIPVVPFHLNDDWNIVSRTVIPVVQQNRIYKDELSEFGLGDATESIFLSPSLPTDDGVLWGVGPAFLIPLATDDRLGHEKWGAGPTGVIIRQTPSGWTYGIYANHLWSIDGTRRRGNVSQTFVEPFVAYTTPSAVTYTVKVESTYDWEARQRWTVPVTVTVGKLLHLGRLPINLAGGVRGFMASPDSGADWGLRLTVTFILPK
ncbi:transporter [Dyella sp. EPa41]|uniref:transporter n=1 Tax=Dyella sp. EPa41 TaxID=1561194 RepID=UPI00191594C6|nr:transporter [Dyella sp. EPa41]